MNMRKANILTTIIKNPCTNQRALAALTGYSLGMINKTVKELMADGYLKEGIVPTEKALEEYESSVPENAVILAAGFGMRMVPINLVVPKAMLEVRNEPLIERLIRQLHEAGVRKITVIVGFMKESFEYLIDEYGVKLVFNPDYAKKNNLFSLALAAGEISNTYIVPSNIWSAKNPFRTHELCSWYMVSDQTDQESDVRVNRKKELVKVSEQEMGNTMLGICYLKDTDASLVRDRILKASACSKNNDEYWETALFDDDKMIIPARVVPSRDIVEINTYEQLRELDGESNNLKSEALDVIAEVFGTSPMDIVDIQVLKKGMTNRSFLFSVHGEKYIMRIPGEGTDHLINREQEAEVFRTISGLGLCDDPVYINPANGYKITKFLDGIRVCDPDSIPDLTRCMEKLRQFHEMKLTVPHTFDIFEQLEFYESLRNGKPSMFKDYARTKANVFRLKEFIDGLDREWCLSHIDAVPDNFLFYRPDGQPEELLQLTDWEYAGMQDPHVDIAMFSIYSMYGKEQIDRLIDIYFQNECDQTTRAKIYAYVAACGLLWSNWCEFKHNLGVEFGEYSLRQYRYAKDYYKYCRELI